MATAGTLTFPQFSNFKSHTHQAVTQILGLVITSTFMNDFIPCFIFLNNHNFYNQVK